MKHRKSWIAGVALAMCASVAVASRVTEPIVSEDLPSSMDEMLSRAMSGNPDVLLADAKLQQAQAELRQTRLKVTQDVVNAFHQLRLAEQMLQKCNTLMHQIQQRFEGGLAPQTELTESMYQVNQSEANLQSQMAHLRYLLGIGNMDRSGGGSPESGGRSGEGMESSSRKATRPALTGPWLDALQVPVQVSFEDTSLEEIMRTLQEMSQGTLAFLIDPRVLESQGTFSFTLPEMPVKNVLTVIADLAADSSACFVIRDYGVLVTTPAAARKMHAPTIPEGLPLDDSLPQ